MECVDIKAKVNLCFIIICDRHEISALPPLSLCLCSRQLSTLPRRSCEKSQHKMDFNRITWVVKHPQVKLRWFSVRRFLSEILVIWRWLPQFLQQQTLEVYDIILQLPRLWRNLENYREDHSTKLLSLGDWISSKSQISIRYYQRPQHCLEISQW